MTTFKELREKERWSRKLLAKELGFKTQATIAKWEKGDSRPRAKELPKLAGLLKVSIEDVLKSLDEQCREVE